jgi:hypothetical protein
MNEFGLVFLLGQQPVSSTSPLTLGIAILVVFLGLGIFAFVALWPRKTGNAGSLAQQNRRSILAVVMVAMVLLGAAFAIPPAANELKKQRNDDENQRAQADESRKKTAIMEETVVDLTKKCQTLERSREEAIAKADRQLLELDKAKQQTQLAENSRASLQSENERLNNENKYLYAGLDKAKSLQTTIANMTARIDHLNDSLRQYAQSSTVSRPVRECCYRQVSPFSTVTELPPIVMPSVAPVVTQGSIYLSPSTTYYYPPTWP